MSQVAASIQINFESRAAATGQATEDPGRPPKEADYPNHEAYLTALDKYNDDLNKHNAAVLAANAPNANDELFEIEASTSNAHDAFEPASPVCVKFTLWCVRLGFLGGMDPVQGFVPLELSALGTKRIRIYCSDKMAKRGISLIVDNGPTPVKVEYWVNDPPPRQHGSYGIDLFKAHYTPPPTVGTGWVKESKVANTATLIGRRQGNITESLHFSGVTQSRLRYCYDSPEVKVIQQTTFRNAKGSAIAPPQYDPETGTFTTREKAWGALMVQYSPWYSLYEIVYDNGQSLCSDDYFVNMQREWMRGNIKKGNPPPVRLLAISDQHIAEDSFEREFFPIGAPKTKWAIPGKMHNANGDEDTDLNFAEDPETRRTVLQKIYNPSDPTQYLEVQKTIYFEATDPATNQTITLRLLNGD